MTDIVVDTARKRLTYESNEIPCLIGKGGVIDPASKKEGDGATPLGRWPVRTVLLRSDRVTNPPAAQIPWRWLRPDDGWSDDPCDPAYNRPVRHPHLWSAEHLWRADAAYDLIVTLGHNDMPPDPGKGSAIFLHCIGLHDHTEGCIAIEKECLLALVPLLRRGDHLLIR